VQNTPQLFAHNVSDVATLTISSDFNWGNLKSYTQMRWDNSTSQNDLTGDDGAFLGGFLYLDLGINTFDKTLSQEFLATSAPGTKLQWTAGAFAFSNTDIFRAPARLFLDRNYTIQLGGVNPAGSGTTTESIAAYADATYEFIPDWFFTLGARFSHDEVVNAYDEQPPGPDLQFPSIKSNHVTPRVVLRWKPDEHSSIYASVSAGYKSAVINVACGTLCLGAGAVASEQAKPENIRSYEVGYKYAGHGFNVSTDAFFYDYRRLQVSNYVSQTTAFTTNASKAHIEGIEVQGDYRILPSLTADGSVTYLNPMYESFTNDLFYHTGPASLDSFVPTPADGSGKQIQRAPRWSFNVGLHYTTIVMDGTLRLSGNYSYTSKIYFDPSDQFQQDGYGLLGLRAEWTDPTDTYTVALYGDNVTDEKYIHTVSYDSFGINSQWGEPATVGASVRVHF
jgi:iron complex outermembrane receptor protein